MPGFIGLPEILLLGLVCLILFGPKRLPEMGRGLGKGLREFKDSVSGDNKDDSLSLTSLEVPGELTAATTIGDTPVVVTAPAEPVLVEPVSVRERNVA
jgi:sec-independent protein translocase protein TatA